MLTLAFFARLSREISMRSRGWNWRGLGCRRTCSGEKRLCMSLVDTLESAGRKSVMACLKLARVAEALRCFLTIGVL